VKNKKPIGSSKKKEKNQKKQEGSPERKKSQTCVMKKKGGSERKERPTKSSPSAHAPQEWQQSWEGEEKGLGCFFCFDKEKRLAIEVLKKPTDWAQRSSARVH